MLIDIHLGFSGDYTLTYELFEHRVANRIWNRFQEMSFEFVSRTQFYNFGETEESVRDNLNDTIDQIKSLLPDQFRDHTDLNSLHVNFPDLVQDSTGELRQLLSMFNYHLHHLEDITRYKNRRFLFSTQDEGEPLEQDDYSLFTPTRLNNYLYMNYPHVGKHLMELFYDQDVNIPAQHIVPTSILKNDLVAWFGRDQYSDADSADKIVKKVKRWCLQLADRLPYPIDDPRLAIGHIPLGKLVGAPDLDMIAANRFIHSVTAR